MMKKAVAGGGGATAAPGIPVRYMLRLSWKLVIGVCIILCLMAFLRLQYSLSYSDSEPGLSPPTSFVRHRSRFMSSYEFEGNAKIAFLFLARRNLPLDFFWGSFFEVNQSSLSQVLLVLYIIFFFPYLLIFSTSILLR